jgi:hypothetical protein
MIIIEYLQDFITDPRLWIFGYATMLTLASHVQETRK